jgi:hypothetical protein
MGTAVAGEKFAHMTELLRKAVEKMCETFPDYEQDAFATWMLDALDSEEPKWEALLSSPAGSAKLEKLVSKARKQIKAGLVKPLDPEDL